MRKSLLAGKLFSRRYTKAGQLSSESFSSSFQSHLPHTLRKFYLPIFGSGLGHVTRIYALAEKLKRRGDEFAYSSFDEGLEFLRAQGERVYECPSIDLRWSDTGGFSSQSSFARFPLSLLAFSKQVTFEREMISSFQPNVVICDSRLSGVFAARAQSRPVITILNQFKILFPPRFRRNKVSRAFEKVEGNVLGLLWTLSDEILMPDLPPPYTIGEANVSGTKSARRIRYVGFMANSFDIDPLRRERAKSTLGLDDRPLVFIQISGPSATKSRFTQTSIEVAKMLSRKYNVVVSLGDAGGSQVPNKIANNFWMYEWCPIKDELFSIAQIIVARAGHTTISQCIDNAKPAVYVPIANHSEQLWNAIKCEALGIGVKVTSENLTVHTLHDSIEKCMNGSDFGNNVEKLRSISKRYRGLETAERIVESYL